MWMIIAVACALLGSVLGVWLFMSERSPVIRRHYRQLGWTDGARAFRETPPLIERPHGFADLLAAYRAGPATELTMSRRCFTYYLDGYKEAFEYARWQEGITATRRDALDRVRRLDTEIRQAHHELKETP